LDSPLSAVDWHTGNHIMHFAINGLLKHKTVVMVTHQLSLLSEFDIMAVVKEGRFDYCGPYNTDVLLQNFPSFAEDYASIQLAEQKKKAASGADASEPSKTGLF
jgi:ABC-type transport system involved in cytochrome bd biosynthesis fused ATPase/permease subunit